VRYFTFPGCFILFYFILSTDLKSQELQSRQDLLVKDLTKEGFENIGIKQAKGDVYIFYENRAYRWEIDGLSRILKHVAETFNDTTRVHIVPLHYQVPVTVVTTMVGEYKKLLTNQTANNLVQNTIDVALNTDSLISLKKEIILQNKSRGRIDLIFLPGFRVQLGNFDNPVEWQFSISPILQTSLWKGNLLTAQLFIPLHNSLQQSFEGNTRLETATINQLFRLPKNIFVNVSSGLFSFRNKINSYADYKRYGFVSEMRKYFLNGRICTGGYIGLTGYITFSSGYFNYWPLEKINFAFFGEYRNPTYDFTTRLTAGKFLYDDMAVRIDLSRQFKELNIGLFAIKSEFGTVGGFNFIIPISPKKLMKPSCFRVNLAKYFNWEFRESTVDPSAATLNTNNDLNETARNLNPDFIRKQLSAH
jgi:hypothetical protein